MVNPPVLRTFSEGIKECKFTGFFSDNCDVSLTSTPLSYRRNLLKTPVLAILILY